MIQTFQESIDVDTDYRIESIKRADAQPNSRTAKMTFMLTIAHHYSLIGIGVAMIAGIVTIRQRERLPDRLFNLAILVVLWPLALASLLVVLLFPPDIFDCTI